MSWTRESLVAVVLALCAPWAMAESITVNTTKDDFADNSLCSLREAVEYYNRGKPSGGFQGCVTPSGTPGSGEITLPAKTDPYVISGSSINVRTSLSINGEGRKGSTVTTVQVVGAHRAFVISDNPVYTKPKCATGATVDCATTPAAFDVDPASDTGTVGDYLTTNDRPTLKGVLPPVTLAPNTYVLRLYLIPKVGDRVEVGQTRIPFSNSPMPWQVNVTKSLPMGVAHLAYTLETVLTATGEVLVAEGPLSSDTVKLAVYPLASNDQVLLSKMVIKGACPGTVTGCANDADDNVTVTNSTAAASYDEYALTYTNGVVGTTDNGGVIFNDEALTLSDVWLDGGQATKGGGVYVSSVGRTTIEKTDLQSNTADHGAAIYAEVNSLAVERSLLRLNTVTNPAGGGAVLEVGSGTTLGSSLPSHVTNSTISGNTGLGLSLVEGAYVNASTIVDNAGGGLDFKGLDVRVFNTILAGNTGGADCQNLPATTYMNSSLVVVPGSCPTAGNQVIDNVPGGSGQLLATLVGGKCASPYGILCPLADRGGATFVHAPRVLDSYASDPLGIGASPVINKGYAGATTATATPCPSNDQREMGRSLDFCDIGAAEFQDISSGVMDQDGGVIKYGQSFTGYLDTKLKDEEPLPAADCPAAVVTAVSGVNFSFPPPSLAPDTSRVVPDTYRPDVPGCPWLEKAPTRGSVTFQADGSYTYKPYSDFHGFDVFDLHVVSTLSRMNALPSDRSRLGRVKVIVEPATGMVSSKVGGGLDVFLVMGLMFLGIVRRGGRS